MCLGALEEETMSRHAKRGWMLTWVIAVLAASVSSTSIYDKCDGALGMQSGDIKDEDISASSSYTLPSVGPQNARLEKDLNSGAWCPKSQISEHVHEYLEVSLRSLHVVTRVATQGRFGNGRGVEYSEHYKLEYWRPGLPRFVKFSNRRGEQILNGNVDTYTVVQREVDPPMLATKVRFVPFSTHTKTMCMRVELYGCPRQDGLLSYSMPQGERRGVEVDLSDMTYDGVKDDSYLHGGLGQLTDGVLGDDNFRQDISGLGKGYEWVGWKNDTTRPVEILFEFDTIRNFSAAYFFCNNAYLKEVQVFASAKIWFSVGGKYFSQPPVNFSYVPDLFMEKARNVTIHLYHRVGKFVKVELGFASRWMLVSEVSFNSVPAVGNFSDENPPAAPPIVSTAMNGDSLTNQYVGLVIGVLAAVILLLVVVILIIIVRNKRRKHTTPHTILKPVDNRVTINMKDLGLSYSPCSPLACQQNGSVYGHPILFDDSDPDKLLYQEPQDFKIAYPGTYSNESTTSREYAVPDVTRSATSTPSNHPTSANKPAFPQTLPKPLQKPPSERYYAATDVVKLPNLQGVSGNTVYGVPNGELLSDSTVREIPRHRLHFIEKLGEGQFGEVNLCEAEGIPELVDVPCRGTTTLVAVKTLRRNANDQARRDFHKEVKILSSLRDPNIVHVLGVCTKDEPLCMVVEYMEQGDLNQFLRKHVPENGTNSPLKSMGANVLSHGSLIFMATQIASGMKYLESLNFVHRDLATRNCLVGRSLTIKIADFGMSRGLYSGDYYRIEGKAMLPIRWMAWESILMGKFTTKSDVWAFAVTTWEILTFARQQPFAELTDEKVIENVSHFYHNDGQQTYLPQPPNCPKEIFDLMKECWQRNDQDRPNFREIHLFLQRKNLGYSPNV